MRAGHVNERCGLRFAQLQLLYRCILLNNFDLENSLKIKSWNTQRKPHSLHSACSSEMFTSQTSSFQDSIDVDDRDEYDSEEIAGYSQKIQLNCYYTIYLYKGTRYCLFWFKTQCWPCTVYYFYIP